MTAPTSPPSPTTKAPSSSSSSSTPSFQNVKAVIFDIDGTLADSWKLGFDATFVVLEKHGIPHITEEIYHECTRYSTPDRLARHAGYQPGDDKFESVGKELAKEFDELYVGLVTTKTAGFFEGIHSVVEAIPVKIGALTNACINYAHAVLKVNLSSEMIARFESIHGADTVPTPKPSPDGLYVVCKELGVDPSECVYIGDSPSDAVAAKAAGMPSIGVLWGSHGMEQLQEAPFSVFCKTPKELQALLPQTQNVAMNSK